MARKKWYGWVLLPATWNTRSFPHELEDAFDWAQQLALHQVASVAELSRQIGVNRSTIDARIERLRRSVLGDLKDAGVRSRARRPPPASRRCAEAACDEFAPRRSRDVRGRRPNFCDLHSTPRARAARSRARSAEAA